MARDDSKLSDLRQQIDDIDNQILALIQRRTQVVESVRDAKEGDPVKIRPSREAQVLERLVRQHKGPFPRRELVRIWRELIVATLSFEGPFSVAVFDSGEGCGYWDLARDQYGSFTQMTGFASPRRVIEAVRSHQATVGILPIPRHEDEDPWWPHLATEHEEAPRVIARLPFAGPGNARGGGDLEAVVICPIRLEETGRDRTFLVIEASDRIGTAHLRETLLAAGLEPDFMTAWQDRGTENWLHLTDVEGLVRSADPRVVDLMEKIQALVVRTVSLGGYARPLSAAELDG